MESIFGYILAHLTEDCRLPEDFRLPNSTNVIYLRRSPDADCRAALDRLAGQLMAYDKPKKGLRFIEAKKGPQIMEPEEGMRLIAPVAAQYPAVMAADILKEAIMKRLCKDNLYKLAELGKIGVWICLNSADAECVKYGLVLCEISNVSKWSEAAEEIILALSLCEEFTDFSASALHI